MPCHDPRDDMGRTEYERHHRAVESITEIDGVSFSARADMRSGDTVVSGRRGNLSLSTLVIVEPTPVMRGWPFPSKEELLRHSKECHEVRMRNRQRELDAVRLILRDMGGASR